MPFFRIWGRLDMDRTAELLEALEARAREKSLEELERKGRTRVKVIRPSEIAGMIQEAVEKAVAGSGYVPPEEVERLVQEGRAEFQDLLAKREEEAARLEEARAQVGGLEKRVEELEAALHAAEEAKRDLEEKLRGLESQAGQASPAAPQAGGFNAELMMKLMGEIAELKAQVASPGPAPQAGAGGEETKIASMLEQVMNSLEGKIEKIGKKVGIHQAVEGEEVKLDALFTDHGDEDFENNLDTVQVKERSGAGIAANLERMKKLRRQGG